MPSKSLTDWLQSANEDPSKKNVHRVRTSIRRCEGVVKASEYPPSNKEDQVLKRLKKVRKAAGYVRDLDIHLGLLGSDELQQASLSAAREQVESVLARERKEAEKDLVAELGKALANGAGKKAEKLCARASKQLPADLPVTVDKQLRALARESKLDDAEGLHNVRIELKKTRYALEARNDQALKPVVEALKKVHDAIGEWHDWTTLADIAAEHLSKRSAFVVEVRRKAASLFVKAIEETERFFAPYQAVRKAPMSVTVRIKSVRTSA
jgi:CHAD domain-containing protein